jgi:hypothetical protein
MQPCQYLGVGINPGDAFGSAAYIGLSIFYRSGQEKIGIVFVEIDKNLSQFDFGTRVCPPFGEFTLSKPTSWSIDLCSISTPWIGATADSKL